MYNLCVISLKRAWHPSEGVTLYSCINCKMKSLKMSLASGVFAQCSFENECASVDVRVLIDRKPI